MKPMVVCRRLFAVAMLLLPLAGTSVAQQQETQQQRAQSQPYNNAPTWRDVRSGKEEYTSIKGRETGVLVQTYGETWRQLKNSWITPIAGWLIAAVVLVIGAFYKWRGSIKVHGKKPHGGDDHVARSPLRRALEGTLYERLRGEQGGARRIDERRNGRPRGGVEPLEARIDLLGGRPSRDHHGHEQRERRTRAGGRHEPPPTVSTELGSP